MVCCGGIPDSKVHGANMGPTRVLSAPGGPNNGSIILAIRGGLHGSFSSGAVFEATAIEVENRTPAIYNSHLLLHWVDRAGLL